MAGKTAAMTKVSKALLDLLNKAIAREIQVSIQYMWQHVQWVESKDLLLRVNSSLLPSLR